MRFKLLPNVTAVTPGQPCQVRLPVPGPTFDALQVRAFNTAGAVLADVTNIKLVVDGNVIQEYPTAARLDDLNQYHGRPAASGAGTAADPLVLTIYCSRPELSSFQPKPGLILVESDAERVTALRTGDVRSAWIELTIAGAGAGLTAFSAEAPIAAPEPMGLITRVKPFTYNPASTGDFETLYDLPRGKGSTGIIAVHLAKAANNINTVTVKEGGFIVFDSVTKAALQKFQSDYNKKPVAGYTVLDFLPNGNLNEVLLINPNRDIRATVNFPATAEAITATVEYLTTRDDGM